jgi:hypothetical protein
VKRLSKQRLSKYPLSGFYFLYFYDGEYVIVRDGRWEYYQKGKDVAVGESQHLWLSDLISHSYNIKFICGFNNEEELTTYSNKVMLVEKLVK